VAAVWGGNIYTSTDSGVTWAARESARNWLSVASSADGGRLVAAENPGKLYASDDSGVTWTVLDATDRNWQQIASSSDGSKLVAVVQGGYIYTISR
jgi:photosystem II stability/assembly factor-like uncharacterized protein